jgi:XTP/dITP diphosphohydrolase
MTCPLNIVLASSNPAKLAELRALLSDLPIELVAIGDVLRVPFSVVEDGTTFEDNAMLKARAASDATGMLALADDSGLEVEVLGGRPGVRSARFAHERATDAENNAALLRELTDIEEEQRLARFRCVLSLASPWEAEVLTAEGRCEGRIASTPRGSGGFGYDPLFVVSGFDGRTMAELSEDEKNSISHRARAVGALRAPLVSAINRGLDEVQRIVG